MRKRIWSLIGLFSLVALISVMEARNSNVQQLAPQRGSLPSKSSVIELCQLDGKFNEKSSNCLQRLREEEYLTMALLYEVELAKSTSSIDFAGAFLTPLIVDDKMSFADRLMKLNPKERKKLLEQLQTTNAGAVSERDASITAAVNSFRKIPVIYNRPKFLNYGKSNDIVLSIASADLGRAQSAVSRGKGKARAVSVKLGEHVHASLDGPPDLVDITLANSPDDKNPAKSPSSQSNATWTWHVVPKTLNDVTLTLSISNDVDINGKMVPIEGPAYEDTFTIDATLWQKWSSVIGAIWLQIIAVTSGFSAIFTASIEFRRWRREKANHGKMAPQTFASLDLAPGELKTTRKSKRRKSQPTA